MAKVQVTPSEWLRSAAVAKGLNQPKLSKALGVSVSVVCRWLNGERLPNWSSALKIEKLLGIPAKVWLDAAEERAARKAG